MPSAPTITFEVRASRWVPMLVLGVAALCLMALVIARIPWWARLGVAVAVLGYAWHCLRADSRRQVTGAHWRGDGSWVLELADGTAVQSRLDGSRALGPAIFLRFSWREGHRANMSLWPDNADPDTRRRLRVRLRASSNG